MDRDPSRSIGRLVYMLNRFADRYARCVLAPHGITKEQLLYLGSLIHEGDGVTQEEIASRLHVDKSTAARMVASMAARGFVTRERVEGNVRAYRVTLTDKATRLWRSIVENLWHWQEVITVDFEEEERAEAIRLLNRMVDNAAAAHQRGFR